MGKRWKGGEMVRMKRRSQIKTILPVIGASKGSESKRKGDRGRKGDHSPAHKIRALPAVHSTHSQW